MGPATVSAIRDGRKIVDTVIESNIGNTGRVIFIGNDSGQSNFKVVSNVSEDEQLRPYFLISNLSIGRKEML